MVECPRDGPTVDVCVALAVILYIPLFLRGQFGYPIFRKAMVYRGRSSHACATCRGRKIKCDIKVPECTQCVRLGQKCPGYRDPLDLLFCHETMSVTTKSQKLARRKLDRSSCRNPESRSGSSVTAGCSAHSLLEHDASPTTLLVSPLSSAYHLENLAINYFFSNYVLSCEGSVGHLGYLHTLRTRGFYSPALTTALVAVGTAGLASATYSQELQVDAKRKYCSALSHANAALRNPVMATQDETMAAIMLLGLYEVVTCTGQKSLESWNNHIYGALALVELRGKQQFESEVGLQQFLYLRTQLTIACVQRSERVPSLLQKLDQEAEPFKTESQVFACRLGNIAANLCDVRAAMHSRAYSDALRLMATCIDIKNELQTWASNMSSRMECSIENLECISEDAYEGRCHVYKSLWSAWLWNCYRGVNIMIHRTILSLIRPLILNLELTESTVLSSQYHESITELHQSASDILASVHFHLRTQGPDKSSPQVIGGLFIIWGLYIAARTNTSVAKNWAISRLQHVTQTTGIQQASALAKVLEKKNVLLETLDNI